MVTNRISHQDPTVVRVTIDGETLTTTKEHPFYTFESGWQEVDDLSVGEHIRKADGTYGTVTKIEVNQLPQWMYNLTVDQAHTFYVGDQDWLVHNACWKIGPGGERTSVESGSMGDMIANLAKDYYGKMMRWQASRTTIAIGQLNNGTFTPPVVNGSAPNSAAIKIGAIKAPGNVHAETYLLDLYGSQLKAIGVSNAKGPCPYCQSFFDLMGFWEVYFNDIFR